MLDTLASEYAFPSYHFRGELRDAFDWILWHLPLARAFALYAAIGPRYGIEPKGPTYVEAAMIRAKRQLESPNEKV